MPEMEVKQETKTKLRQSNSPSGSRGSCFASWSFLDMTFILVTSCPHSDSEYYN